MCTSFRMTALLSLLIMLVAGTGCSTFYYKRFVVGGSPRGPNPAIRIDDMTCYFEIDAIPTDRHSFEDSVYQVSVSLFTGASGRCQSDRVQSFKTLQLDRFSLQINDSLVEISDRLISREELGPCWIDWRYPSITISDHVSSLAVGISLSYQSGDSSIVRDTLVTLIRQTGKERELVSF